MFKVFPCGSNKKPLILGWPKLASSDPDQQKLWSEMYAGSLAYWGIPTGPDNNLLALDIDVKHGDGFKSISDSGLPVPQTMHQRTRSGGSHYVYKYPTDGKYHGNRAGIIPDVDIRGDGGYIIHYGFDNTPMVEAPEWITKDASVERVEASGDVIAITPSIAEDVLNTCLETVREAPAGESNVILNTEAFKVGQLVASGTMTRESAEKLLLEAAIDRGKPVSESKKTINSGLNGGNSKPLRSPFDDIPPEMSLEIPKVPAVEIWTPKRFVKADLFDMSKLRKPQLFKDWSTEDIHLTTADGGTGKSTLKLMEAICLALGDRFLGFNNLQRGRTLFITGEDSAPKLGAMIGMICKQMGLWDNKEKMDIILDSIIVKKASDLCLIGKGKDGFLNPNNNALTKIMQAVDEYEPKMIVFDPISSFWGSESALNDMGKAVGKFMGALVEKSNACVEMINHMGKQSSSNKDMSQFASRGGTGLPSNSRVSRVFRPLGDEEYTEFSGVPLGDKESAMLCNVNKFTDGSPLLNTPFLIVRQGYLFRRIDIEPSRIREDAVKISDIERVFRFLSEARKSGKYPTKSVVIGHFMNTTSKLSQARSKSALDTLVFTGFEGVLVKAIENPDATNREVAFIITDVDGVEL